MRHRVLRHSFVFRQKVPLGVDYGNCMHRMAEDIDAAPTVSILAKSSNQGTVHLLHRPKYGLKYGLPVSIAWSTCN